MHVYLAETDVIYVSMAAVRRLMSSLRKPINRCGIASLPGGGNVCRVTVCGLSRKPLVLGL